MQEYNSKSLPKYFERMINISGVSSLFKFLLFWEQGTFGGAGKPETPHILLSLVPKCCDYWNTPKIGFGIALYSRLHHLSKYSSLAQGSEKFIPKSQLYTNLHVCLLYKMV